MIHITLTAALSVALPLLSIIAACYAVQAIVLAWPTLTRRLRQGRAWLVPASAAALVIVLLPGCEMSEQTTDIVYLVLQMSLPFLAAGLTWLLGKMVLLITAKIRNQYVIGLLQRLHIAVAGGVQSVQQRWVDAIKEGRADGKLDQQERARANQEAKQAALAYLGTKGLGEIMKVLGLGDGEMERLLNATVESEVRKMKPSSAGAKKTTAAPPLAQPAP